MTVYLVAQLKFKDRVAYNRYQKKFMDVFQKFNGTLLAADEKPTVLEGAWHGEKVVMMSFPDADSCRRFRSSFQYQEIAVDRRKGADAIVLLVTGFLPKR